MNLSSISAFCSKPQTGLLILRVAAGLTMLLHGIPKFIGGAETLSGVGKAVAMYGIDFNPLFWGILAALTETVGGVFIMLGGVCFRAAAFFLSFVMLTAILFLKPEFSLAAFGGYAHPWMMLWVFVALFFMGPGEYSLKRGK
ncbi:MAG: DoxX family protein [Opitutales bacterium]|nr:DoxX family protein [Opitutales bacterium]